MTRTTSFSVLCLALAVGGGIARAREEPPPPGRRDVVVQRRWHPGLIFGGIAVSSVAYTASVIASAAKNDVCQDGADYRIGCRTETWPLYVPFVGPFIQMGYIGGTNSQSAYALLAVDGAVQLGGLTMIIVGAALSTPAANRPVRADRWRLAPTFSTAGGGLALQGRF